MPVITEQRATALEREATVRPLGELAAYLQEALGQRMAAHLAGLEHAKQIGRYARGVATPRNDLTVRRIREGYKIVRMLVDAYDATTAKAWLFGTNTRLDDRQRGLRRGGPRRPPVLKRRRVTEAPEFGRVWRVGLASDPLGFIPAERRSYNSCFDDLLQRFGTLYCALLAETALREVLADLRPNAAAIARYIKLHGTHAAADIPSAPVTAIWRQRHVLAPARVRLDGPVLDLTDVDQRREVELRHAEVLAEHGMAHLGMHEITTPRRVSPRRSPAMRSSVSGSPRSASPRGSTGSRATPSFRGGPRSSATAIPSR
jgi:hypothetical protein